MHCLQTVLHHLYSKRVGINLLAVTDDLNVLLKAVNFQQHEPVYNPHSHCLAVCVRRKHHLQLHSTAQRMRTNPVPAITKQSVGEPGVQDV